MTKLTERYNKLISLALVLVDEIAALGVEIMEVERPKEPVKE